MTFESSIVQYKKHYSRIKHSCIFEDGFLDRYLVLQMVKVSHLISKRYQGQVKEVHFENYLASKGKREQVKKFI